MSNNNLKIIQLQLLSGLKAKNNHSGFTLIEVLVTILVVTGFVLGSLQAVVLATFFRVQAQDKNEALNWVQQDLELIRYQAFSLDIDPDNPESSLTLSRNDACTNSTYGTRLEDFIDGNYLENPANPISVNGKNYRVFRTYTPSGNTLVINHVIAYAPASSGFDAHPRYNSSASYSTAPDEDNPNRVTTLSTEVIPDAALSYD